MFIIVCCWNRSRICIINRNTFYYHYNDIYDLLEEIFKKKIDALLNDDSAKIFACLRQREIKGVIAVTFLERHRIEIIAIAVDASARCQGIGSYMVNKVVNDYSLVSVYAETDDDAVGFYRKNGFSITEFSETYESETVIRYKCELTK